MDNKEAPLLLETRKHHRSHLRERLPPSLQMRQTHLIPPAPLMSTPTLSTPSAPSGPAFLLEAPTLMDTIVEVPTTAAALASAAEADVAAVPLASAVGATLT